ncbi:conserved hypothetical protein [Afipia carboxidovorans OM5]|nr:conserved hypothetical protein [Afipia carboxidovorans OM5]
MGVMRGLDPRIHHAKGMDCQVKSGNDTSMKNDTSIKKSPA